MRDVKMVGVTDGHFGKECHFLPHPWGKWFSPRIFVPWKFLKNLISIIWDSFHGGASPSYDLFFNVTDGQNANTELITLSIVPASIAGARVGDFTDSGFFVNNLFAPPPPFRKKKKEEEEERTGPIRQWYECIIMFNYAGEDSPFRAEVA